MHHLSQPVSLAVLWDCTGTFGTGPSFWSGIFPHSHGPFLLQLLQTLVWPGWRLHSSKPAQNVHLSKPGNGFSFGECGRTGKGGNGEGQKAVRGKRSKKRTKINRQKNPTPNPNKTTGQKTQTTVLQFRRNFPDRCLFGIGFYSFYKNYLKTKSPFSVQLRTARAGGDISETFFFFVTVLSFFYCPNSLSIER